MANNRIQIKRTSVSGRTANTTSPANSQYIAAGELALNMPDGILYSSNGSELIVVGANVVNQNITGNLTVKAVIANGSIGTAGQTLSSNGSAVYWASVAGTGTVTQVDTGNGLSGGPITSTGTISVNANNGIVANTSGLFVKAGDNIIVNSTGVHASAGVNTDAQYSFTNTVTFTQTINGTANNSLYLNSKTEGNLNVNSALNSNNTSFVGTVSAANVVSNAQLSGNLASYVTTTNLTNNLANYQTSAGLAGNVATLAANSATYLGGNTASDLRTYSDQKAGNAYTNAVSYVDGKSYVNTSQLSTNLANYQTTAGLAANVATLTANNTSFVGTVAAANVVSNAQLSGNLANYVTTTNLTNNLVNYQTTAGLASNVATLTSNNTSFVGTVSAANVVSNAQLTGNLSNYQTTAGLASNVATLTANNANYVKANNGITSNSSGVFVTQGTGVVVNATGVHVNATYIGTLSANNATYLNGQLAAYYTNATNITTGTLPYAQIPANVINTTAAFTVTGVHTYNANVILGAGLSANGGFGTAGQVLHSNGTATYWAADDQGVTSVATGNGLTGGTITATGTVSVLANTGIVANATGVYVNSAYIATIASNSATYANSSVTNTFTVGTASYFVANGNLGIGNTAPANKLVVYSVDSTTDDDLIGLGFATFTPYATFGTHNIDGNSGGLKISTKSAGVLSEKVRVDASGNVGIGTSSPSYKLHVNGTGSQEIYISSSDNSETGLRFAGAGGRGRIYADASYNMYIQPNAQYNNPYVIMKAENDSVNQIRVGINTTTPGYTLQVNGSFAATTKSFVIDHPTKQDMKLRYGSLEGPENGVYVRGKSTSKVIELPDYWEGLVDEDSITVTLTSIGKKQSLYVKEIRDNAVVIGGSWRPNYYYVVYAERKDVDKLVVEF